MVSVVGKGPTAVVDLDNNFRFCSTEKPLEGLKERTMSSDLHF